MRVTIIPVRDYDPPGWYAMVYCYRPDPLFVSQTKETPADAIRSARLWVQLHLPSGTKIEDKEWMP